MKKSEIKMFETGELVQWCGVNQKNDIGIIVKIDDDNYYSIYFYKTNKIEKIGSDTENSSFVFLKRLK